MISKILQFFKKTKNTEAGGQTSEKQEKKDEEYQPSLYEMWKFYLQFIKFDYKLLIVNYLSIIINTYVYAASLFIMLDVKNALVDQDAEKLQWGIIKYIALQMLTNAVSYIDSFLNFNQYRQQMQLVQVSILENVLSKDIQYFEDHKITQLSETINQGTNQITRELSYGQLFSKIDLYITNFARLYFIYCQSPYLLINFLAFCFIASSLQFYLSLKKDKYTKELNKKNDMLDFLVDDILNNISVIKTFGTETKETSRINQIISKNDEENKQITKIDSISSIVRSFANEGIKISLILQIFFQICLPQPMNFYAQSLTEIFASSYGGMRFANEIIRLIYQKPENYHAQGQKNIGKVMELFKEKSKIGHNVFAEETDKSQFVGDITFNNVSFKYPISKDLLAQMNQKRQEEEKKKEQNQSDESNSEKSEEAKLEKSDSQGQNNAEAVNSDSLESDDGDQTTKDNNQEENDNLLPKMLFLKKSKSSMKERENVLENISFSIKQGQYVAFVGTSGSGKSTIVKLLQRYYDVNSGSILFDGENIKDCSLNKLRRSIGLVSQEPTLFDNDIEYNITYGCLDGKYTEEDIKQVCQMSGVNEFIEDPKRFPKGLKTLVGSKGMKLSGGQKQRIAIARALLKKPKILILDEATSSLDAESEHQVQQYIDKLVGYRGLTIIVVAHRLSTIVKSDKIFVMKHGQIKEEGSHEELLSQNGIYKKLVYRQLHIAEK